MTVVQRVELGNFCDVAKFGDVLRNLFDDLGRPSQRKHAKTVGIAVNTLRSAFEAETPNDMTSDTLEAIAEALKRSPQELVRIWKGESGSDALLRVMATYVINPDEWFLKLSQYLKWNPTRTRQLIEEVEGAAKEGETSRAS